MNFILWKPDTEINIGKILATGRCQAVAFPNQTGDGEFVMEGEANDVRQKVVFDGLDDEGQPINPRVVDKTPAEIERDNPKTKLKPFKKRKANITNEQLRTILSRLKALEARPTSYAEAKPNG